MSNDRHNPQLPSDLCPLSDALDRLGERERAAAPSLMEARLGAATLPGLRGEPDLRLTDDLDAAPRPVIGRVAAWRIAAAIALVGAGTLGLLMLRPHGAQPIGDPLAAIDVDTLLASAGVIDLPGSDQLGTLANDLDALSDSVHAQPAVPDLDSRDSSM